MSLKVSKRKISVSGPHNNNNNNAKKAKLGNDLTQFMYSTLKSLNELKDQSNFKLNAYFVKMPPKKDYPEYYSIIPQPISLHEIKGKVDTGSYTTTEDFLADFVLLNSNAHTFNEKTSIVAINAKKILDFVQDQVDQYNQAQKEVDLNKDDSSNVEQPIEVKEDQPKKTPKIKLRLTTSSKESVPAKQPETETEALPPQVKIPTKLSIKTKTSTKTKTPTKEKSKSNISFLKTNFLKIIQEISDFEVETVKIAEPFLEEVDTEYIPDYLEVISHPMALNTIKSGVIKNKYKTIDEFAETVDQVWKNAQIYNDEDNLLYQDAALLRKFTNDKIDQLKEEFNALSSNTEQDPSTTSKPEETAEEEPVLEVKENLVEPAAAAEQSKITEDAHTVTTPVVAPAPKKRGRPPKIKNPEEIKEKKLAKLDATINLINEQLSSLEADFAEKQEQEQVLKEETEEDQEVKPELSEIEKLRNNLNLNRRQTLPPSSIQIIEEIAITSSRSNFKQTLKQSTLPLFQSWFEYKFKSQSKIPTNHFTFTLPQQQGSITFDAGMNKDLVQRKFQSVFSVNGEKINVSPSIHYADSDEDFHALYEVKLASGLNKLSYEVTLMKTENLEEDMTRLRTVPQKDYSVSNNGNVDSNSIGTDVLDNTIEKVEKFSVWVQVV